VNPDTTVTVRPPRPWVSRRRSTRPRFFGGRETSWATGDPEPVAGPEPVGRPIAESEPNGFCPNDGPDPSVEMRSARGGVFGIGIFGDGFVRRVSTL
jgi:hypothetical protein